MNLSDITPNLYPAHLLQQCESGLCLFGAGFYGRNDAIHMYHAGMEYVTVVDSDAEKMETMQAMYPREWIFITTDVKVWLPEIAKTTNQSWDIVSVDAPLALMPWVLGAFNGIAKVANKYIVLTMSSLMSEEVAYYTEHLDWKLISVMSRSLSGLVELQVYERVAP